MSLRKLVNTKVVKHNITDPRQAKFLEYLMLPKAFRPHHSFICGKLGITYNQYLYWLRLPNLNEARREMVKQYYKDDIPDVLMAMKNEAVAGNERAARLFLEYVDDFNKQEIKDNPFERPEPIPSQEINIIINNLEQKFYGNDQSKQSERTIIEAGS